MSLILFEVPSLSNVVNKEAYLLAIERIRQQTASLRLMLKIKILININNTKPCISLQ